MVIRELTREELKMAVELNYECWNDDFDGVIPHNSMNVDEDYKFILDWIEDKTCSDIRRIYGAFEDDNFLGFVGGSLADKEDTENGVELNYLFVKKAYRKKALGLRLIYSIISEFNVYGVNQLIVYNWHECESNKFYRYLDGKVIKQVTQKPKGKEVLVDVFSFDINDLINLINNKLYSRSIDNGGFAVNESLSDGISITNSYTEEDENIVCKGLYTHNVKETHGLLKNPNVRINLYLKDNEKTIGAVLCDTYSRCLYVDLLWIDENYRGKNLGKALITKAEKMAKDNGCIFSHTCTFSYQAPEFYKACGYEVFGKLDDYPDGIVEYFLKKKL